MDEIKYIVKTSYDFSLNELVFFAPKVRSASAGIIPQYISEDMKVNRKLLRTLVKLGSFICCAARLARQIADKITAAEIFFCKSNFSNNSPVLLP
ncbi:hypothetical protein KQI74_06540 [Paenibacillus barcinonensis]|uniref:hypothetical protein n=1 Tax=Paenibacillus barcinonensis TaxID=198119 RepID=UPI001C0FFA0A|nr:hypothetical protein [Paenibacillus barcinonensis]MBU5351930.1 hypothetical protein [Paenibacillus barcinonensis]